MIYLQSTNSLLLWILFSPKRTWISLHGNHIKLVPQAMTSSRGRSNTEYYMFALNLAPPSNNRSLNVTQTQRQPSTSVQTPTAWDWDYTLPAKVPWLPLSLTNTKHDQRTSARKVLWSTVPSPLKPAQAEKVRKRYNDAQCSIPGTNNVITSSQFIEPWKGKNRRCKTQGTCLTRCGICVQCPTKRP